jgi:hypothetical protein
LPNELSGSKPGGFAFVVGWAPRHRISAAICGTKWREPDVKHREEAHRQR